MEQWDESFFSDALRLEKLYRSCMRQAAHDHRLSPNEVVVLLFLSSNAPRQDTSPDIMASPRRWSRAAWTSCRSAA